MRIRHLLSLAVVAPLALTTGACMTADITPSAAVTTIDPAATRNFKLEWTAEPHGTNARRLDGYIVSTYGVTAQVQLLAQALDARGQVVDWKIDYPIFPVPGYGRSYFNIGPLAAADHYQVTVWSAYYFQAPKIQ
jgi:hypothetical protein